MKRFSKALLVTVLALAMVLNTCGIVLADGVTEPIVTVTEEVHNSETGVKKLVFSITTPTGSQGVTSAGMAFSFDNTIIQPVNKGNGNDVALSTSNSAPKTPFKAYADPNDPANDNGANFSIAGVKVAVIGNRTGIKMDTLSMDAENCAIDATSGMIIGEFYYKVKEGKSANSETFKLETEGEVFNGLFGDPKTAYAINVGLKGGTTYKYGTPSTTDVEAIARPSMTYTGSDVPVLGSLKIGELTVPGITVPAVYTTEGPTNATAAELNLTATAKSTLDKTMDVPADAVWTVEYPDTEKVTISGTGANATLKVAPGALPSTTPAVIKVAANGKTNSIEVNITRAESPDPVYLEVKDGESVVPNEGVVTIAKPATEGTKTKTLTAKVYHPYGEMTAETTFAVVGTAPAGFGITEAGVISVTNNAEKGDVAIKATSGALTKNITVRVVDLEVDETPIKVAENIKYGMTNADIITFTSVDGTASVDGKTVTGKFSLADPTGKPDAVETTIVVLFTPEGNTGDLAVYNGNPVSINKTVTVNKADQVIAAEDVVVDYDGTAKSVTATLTKGDGEITYAPAQSYTDAGTYTITATAAGTANYNVATKVITLTINKAPTAITAAETQTATYDGTAKAITATITDGADNALAYSYLKEGATAATTEAPTDAGTYTVTISAEATNNWAAPEVKVVTLTINKATVTDYVVSETDPTKAEFDVTMTALEASTNGVTSTEYLADYTLPGFVYAAFEGGVKYVEDVTWTTEDEWNAKEGEYTFTAVFPENGNLIFKPLEATVEVTKVVGTITGDPFAIANKTVAKRRVEGLNDDEPSFADLDLPHRIIVTYPTAGEPGSVDLDIVWNKTVADLKAAAATVTEQNPNATVELEIADATFTPEGHADFSWITIESGNKMTLTITNRIPATVTVEPTGKEYDGAAIANPVTDWVPSEGEGDENATIEVTYVGVGNTEYGPSTEKPVNAGTYEAVAKLNSGIYSGASEAMPFAITAKEIAAEIDDATRAYSDANPPFALKATPAGIVGTDDLAIEFKTTATAESNVGTYVIEAEAGNENYNVSFTNGTLTIIAKDLTDTDFVPEITGDKANGSTLTIKAIEGLDASQYDVFWNDATEAATEYTLSWADSNKTITAVIKGKDNYTGEKPVDEAKVYDIPKYEISGDLAYTNDNGGAEDTKFDDGDKITLDLSGIDGAIIFSELGETPVYTWYLDGEVIENETANNYVIKDADRGKTLSASVSLAEDSDFAGKVEVVVGEIGKSPINGTVTITAEGDVLTATVTDSNATPDDYTVEWYRGETKLTPAEDGTYTVTYDDLGKVITVKVEAKEDSLFTGKLTDAEFPVPAKAPTVTIATSVGATSITVTVNAVENGAPIIGYTITLKNGDTVVGEPHTGTANFTTFEGLIAGTTYTIVATAENSAGETTATATAMAAAAQSSSGLRPPYRPPVTPDTGDGEGTGEGEGTTTPDADVEVKVEDTSAEIGSNIIKDNDAVAVTTKTESGTEVKTTVNVADANVAKLEVSTKDSDKAAAGAAAEGAVGTPVEVKVEAKDSKGNAANVTVDVAIPSEEKAYAYIIDENGVATRTESVYNEETGEVEVANVPDGAVVMLSTTAPATFDDAAEHWAEDTINYAADAGIMNGVGGSSFDPDGNATRGMVNAMMVRLAKVAGVEFAEAADQKVDTDTAHWAAATDLIALANGWSTGVRTLEDGTVVMDTDSTVTREQLVTMLWRFVGNPEAKGEIDTFDDHADTAEWAKDAKAWAVGAGIINGKPGNKLDPNGTATRAEIATMFNRLMKYMTK